jgi:hypothetical protein
MMALGIVSSVISGSEKARKAEEELKDRRNVAETQKNLDLRQTELNYWFARKQGLEDAARSDRSMDLKENLVALAYNASLGGQRAAQETRGFESQMAMMQGDSAVESAYASLGASGARAASTASGAVERQAAVNDQALQSARRYQDRQSENALISAYASLAENQASIGNARYGADWTRKSFEAGGENYEKYQFSKTRINEAWESQQELYQTMLDNARYTAWDFVADALGGATSGFTMGMGMYGFGADLGWWGGKSSSASAAGAGSGWNNRNDIKFERD